MILKLMWLIIPTISSSPVAYILLKNDFNVITHLTSGIIATESIIISTINPLANYIQDQICITGVINFKKLTQNQLKHLCTNIKQIHYDHPLLAVIILQEPLTFFYQINAATIPVSNSLKQPFDLSHNCEVVYHNRNEYRVPHIHFQNVTIPEEDNADILIVDLQKETKFCGADNGLPLYCKGAVVGIVLIEIEDYSSCCAMACNNKKQIKIVKFLKMEVQELLKKFM